MVIFHYAAVAVDYCVQAPEDANIFYFHIILLKLLVAGYRGYFSVYYTASKLTKFHRLMAIGSYFLLSLLSCYVGLDDKYNSSNSESVLKIVSILVNS